MTFTGDNKDLVTSEVTSETSDASSESITNRRLRLLKEYPGYCTAGYIARAMHVTRGVVNTRAKEIKHIVVDGMKLYEQQSADDFIARYERKQPETLSFRGDNADMLRRLCESYYRQNLHTADKRLLAFAKKIAGL